MNMLTMTVCWGLISPTGGAPPCAGGLFRNRQGTNRNLKTKKKHVQAEQNRPSSKGRRLGLTNQDQPDGPVQAPRLLVCFHHRCGVVREQNDGEHGPAAASDMSRTGRS